MTVIEGDFECGGIPVHFRMTKIEDDGASERAARRAEQERLWRELWPTAS